MAVIDCVEIPTPPIPPSINIPNFGILEAAGNGIRSIPDPDELLAMMQQMLNNALAPIKQFLDLLDGFMAVYGCIKAIPEAIAGFSPTPIFECLEKLAQKVAILLSYVPPMSYIRAIVDIASYFIDVLDEIISLFNELDIRITQYIAVFENARLNADLELEVIARCSANEALGLTLNFMDALKLIKPINDILVNVILQFIPVPPLQEVIKDMKEFAEQLLGIEEALETGNPLPGGDTKAQHELVPLPPLGSFFRGLNLMRNAFVVQYNALAPMVGLPANKEMRPTPEFNNF